MKKKDFHISDVLTIGTGRLVSTRHISGVYDILNFMTQDNLFTHQLPRAGRLCKPYILDLYPWMFKLDLSPLDMPDELVQEKQREVIDRWVNKLADKYGDFLPVNQIANWEHIDPLKEAAHLVGKDKIIVVETPDHV